MGVYIPNMEKPKECVECFYGLRCKVVPRWLTADFTISSDCPLIEVDDTVWENEKYKLIRMTKEARINKAMTERRTNEID